MKQVGSSATPICVSSSEQSINWFNSMELFCPSRCGHLQCRALSPSASAILWIGALIQASRFTGSFENPKLKFKYPIRDYKCKRTHIKNPKAITNLMKPIREKKTNWSKPKLETSSTTQIRNSHHQNNHVCHVSRELPLSHHPSHSHPPSPDPP